jgi:hypothetical protein
MNGVVADLTEAERFNRRRIGPELGDDYLLTRLRRLLRRYFALKEKT